MDSTRASKSDQPANATATDRLKPATGRREAWRQRTHSATAPKTATHTRAHRTVCATGRRADALASAVSVNRSGSAPKPPAGSRDTDVAK